MRTIAVFVDGTANDHTDRNPTNILKMHRLTSEDAVSLYFRGLGNEFDSDSLFDRMMGGVFGAGADAKRDEAYAALSAAHQSGDRVFLFGFSRGAAIVRMLAAKIERYGLNGCPAPVTMMGCFDTVASFGIPGNRWDLFKDFHVASNVALARHAVALDETRGMFPVTLMNRRTGIGEMWFRGDHSDVGGGHDLQGLSNIALIWMMGEAEAAGLQFKERWSEDLNWNILQSPYRVHTVLPTSPRVPGVLVDDEFHAGNEVRHYSVGTVRPRPVTRP